MSKLPSQYLPAEIRNLTLSTKQVREILAYLREYGTTAGNLALWVDLMANKAEVN
jgi:hypothetical protein